ncbi:MAG: hypothetical protein ACRBM6_19295 [Geminicoccales bacterium]
MNGYRQGERYDVARNSGAVAVLADFDEYAQHYQVLETLQAACALTLNEIARHF